MKKEKSKESKPMTALERGQEFLDGFKKLPYSTDRIGQSFVMKASVASKPSLKEEVLKTSSNEPSDTEQKSNSPDQTENQTLTTEEFYKKLGIPNATNEMEGKVRVTITTHTRR